MTTESSIASWDLHETNIKEKAATLEIKKPIENVVTEEKGKAVFECEVDGYPLPTCSWYKDGKSIISSQRSTITSYKTWHRLEIRDVNTEDHGVYTIVCRNRSKNISSKAILFVACNNLNLGIYYTHTRSNQIGIVKHLRNVKVEKGNTVRLEVRFQHETTEHSLHHVWFKNHHIINQDHRMLIEDFKKCTTLSLLNAETTDTGVYSVVTRTDQGVVSSSAEVQVIAAKETLSNDELIPIIEQLLPDEIETNEGEEIRLICKAIFDVHTTVQWCKKDKKDTLVGVSKNFIEEDYGNHYIGLRGVNVSESDSGVYFIILRDEKTGREESCSCSVFVRKTPLKNPPVVTLKRPLESAVACCGSKVSFDCSFALEEATYFYVVWYVGHYRVERTNSRFTVVCKGGDFLLYIKKLEPGMAGEVTCELRKALPDQRTIHVNKTSASLTIVPLSVILEERKENTTLMAGKLYNQTASCVERFDECGNTLRRSVPVKDDSNGHVLHGEVILEIAYCRFEEGLFFLHASRGHSKVVYRLMTYDIGHIPAQADGKTYGKTEKFEWDDSMIPTRYWYGVDVEQSGRYVEAGVSSQPCFGVQEAPADHLMKFRVRTVPVANQVIESKITIVPASENILRAPKQLSLRTMTEFEPSYTKTGDVIGCGAFGSVDLVRDRTGQQFAAKVLKTRTQKKRETARREFDVMKKLRHPKLVELIDAFMEKEAFILVMEYLWGGELFDRIVQEEYIKEVDVIPYVRQICEGLEYLHSHKIVHLDLKPENIICLSPNSGQVKIIDFGLARVLEDGHVTRAIYGTKYYVAPEVLNFEVLTLACDMWSLGVITYLLLSGVLPFDGNSWLRSTNITMACYDYDEMAFRDISDLAKTFVDQLLVRAPEKRMSASAALKHKWIKEGPPEGAKAGHMKRTRENLKSYLANYRARWQRAGNVMIAAHRLRTHAGTQRAIVENDTAPSVT